MSETMTAADYRALLASRKGSTPERHAGVSGEAQRRQQPAPTRPAPSGPACYVHSPEGTRGVSLDAALSLIRGGRVRSLDIHTDEAP